MRAILCTTAERWCDAGRAVTGRAVPGYCWRSSLKLSGVGAGSGFCAGAGGKAAELGCGEAQLVDQVAGREAGM